MWRSLTGMIVLGALLTGCIPAPEGRARVVTIVIGIIIAIPLAMLVIALLIGIWAVICGIAELMVKAIWPLVILYLAGAVSLAVGYLQYSTPAMVTGGIILAVAILMNWIGAM